MGHLKVFFFIILFIGFAGSAEAYIDFNKLIAQNTIEQEQTASEVQSEAGVIAKKKTTTTETRTIASEEDDGFLVVLKKATSAPKKKKKKPSSGPLMRAI